MLRYIFFGFILLGFVSSWFWGAAFLLCLVPAINYLRSPLSSTTISSRSNTSDSTYTVSLDTPDDIDNILMEITNGEIKDPVSQDIFHPEENIHFCLDHRLAYHEDSWQLMGFKCMVCGHSRNTKIYQLPGTIELSKMKDNESIYFRDIE